MKERPVYFKTAAEIRAILDGRKTQMRQIIIPQPKGEFLSFLERPIRKDCNPPVLRAWFQAGKGEQSSSEISCPYGKPGDRLWVREGFARVPATAYRCSTGVQQTVDPSDPDMCVVYREGWERSSPGGWRSPISMPRWASRITLEVTGVRVERLQDISGPDCWEEGISHAGWDPERYGSVVECYRNLWESIHGAGSWDANPWVWVVEFCRLSAGEEE